MTDVKGGNIHSAAQFEKAYGSRDWEWYRGLLAECIRHGKPGRWVDLGAGLGLFVECAARFGIHCVGLEGSEYAVEAARRRCPGFDMRQHYLEDPLPFVDGSVATVIFNQTIEHLTPEVASFTLRECHRALERQGVLIVNSPSAYNRTQRREKGHINLYTPRQLRSELVAAGFERVTSLDSPRMLLGSSRPARLAMRILFKALPLDLLSGSANCVAVNPG